MSEPTIHGFCDEEFLPVREAFTENFRLDLELGAAFAAAVEGNYVVDLWADPLFDSRGLRLHVATITCLQAL